VGPSATRRGLPWPRRGRGAKTTTTGRFHGRNGRWSRDTGGPMTGAGQEQSCSIRGTHVETAGAARERKSK